MMSLKKTMIICLTLVLGCVFTSNLYADSFPFDGSGFIWEQGCWWDDDDVDSGDEGDNGLIDLLTQKDNGDEVENDPCYTYIDDSIIKGSLEVVLEGEGIAQELVWYLNIKLPKIEYDRTYKLMNYGGLEVDPSGRFVKIFADHFWQDFDDAADPEAAADPFKNPFIQMLMGLSSKNKNVGDQSGLWLETINKILDLV